MVARGTGRLKEDVRRRGPASGSVTGRALVRHDLAAMIDFG
jgi:hypothetical protein